MKCTVIGIKRVSGVSSKTGNDFDMPRVLVLSEIRPMSKKDLKIEGFGYEISEIACDWSIADQFSKLKLPCSVDLQTDAQPVMGKFETVVVGVKTVQPVQSAA